ncbi:MAG TPA: CPBP family intramembrane glutamic endopeptidase [Acidimicrobiales bacterium]|nr:CPBP family intramembrane glutamic endopeptidase [Acidimicrobiales bacterium]
MPDADRHPAVMDDDTSTVRWGLGDALLGWVVAQVGGFLAGGIALSASGEGADGFDDLSLAWVAVAQAGLWLGLLGAPWLAARLKGHGMVRDFGLRLHGARDVLVGGVAGAVTQFLLIPLVYIPIFLLFDIDTNDLERPARELTDRATEPVGVVLLVLIVGIGAPIIEELFYRGLVQRSLIRRFGPWPGIVVTAVVFGAVHFQPLQLPALTLFGLVLGILAYRTGRLGPSIVAHMVFNMVTVIALVSS